eukprot:1588789-Rhodomonas_salina.1
MPSSAPTLKEASRTTWCSASGRGCRRLWREREGGRGKPCYRLPAICAYARAARSGDYEAS